MNMKSTKKKNKEMQKTLQIGYCKSSPCQINIFVLNNFNMLAGTVAEWSRALVQNHLEWTVPSLNPSEGCYGDGELS